ncbi:MAG: Phage minor structural protein [Thermoleophilia bacterium]|nr:Phage minor structural protein [Thermoleophilia bacterium]
MNDPQPDPNASTPPAGTEATPQAGTPDPNVSTTPPAGTAQTVEVTPEIQKLIDDAAARASREANKEAVAAKQRAKALEDAEAQRQHEALSETERLQKERDDATQAAADATDRARRAQLRAEVATVATTLNLVDADAALALLPADAITFDDDGTPVGVEAALKQLAESKPYLVAVAGTPKLDPTNGGRGGGTPTVSDTERLAQIRNPNRNADIWRR